jgi:hypothetical protein
MGDWKTQYAAAASCQAGSSELSRIREGDAQAALMNGPKLGTPGSKAAEAAKHLVDLLRQSSRKKLIL